MKQPKLDHTLDQCYAALAKAAAEQNPDLLPDELYLLAVAADHGAFGIAENHELAVSLARRAADSGHPLACLTMASLDYQPTDSSIPADALVYLTRAAELGDPEASMRLGLAYIQKHASEPMPGAALKLLRRAADSLYPNAMGMTAFYLHEECADDKDALRLARLYAALELTFGQPNVVEEHLDMFFTENDCDEEGNIDLKKVIAEAAEAGDAVAKYASYILAVTKEDGTFTGDTDESRRLLREAAEGGIPDAMERLALLPENSDRVFELLQEPASLGLPQSMLPLGLMCLEGRQCSLDKPKALSLIFASLNYALPLARMTVADLVGRQIVPDPYGAREDFYRLMSLDKNGI